MKKNVLLLSIVIGTSSLLTNAQSNSYTLNSSGGSTTLSGNLYEWSVGEMVLVNTSSTPSLIVTQGLLQPSIQEVGIKGSELSGHQLSVYPNPTADFLNIKAQLPTNAILDIKVFDITGRVFQNKTVQLKSEDEVQTIDFRPYVAGIYILEVKTDIDGKLFRNSFKIINNK